MNEQKGNTEAVENPEVDNSAKKDETVPKRVRWLTRAMAEDFTRQDVLFTTFKEAFIYIVFVISVTMCTIGRRTPSMFYITQALKQQFLIKEYTTAHGVTSDFSQLNTLSDFWNYAETLMVDSLYWEEYSNPNDPESASAETDKKIIFENKLLGVPRLRQVKVRNDSCVIHNYFKSLFESCYGEYSSEAEDRGEFGPGTGTAWVYNTPKQTQAQEYHGRLTTYGAGGYYQDLSTRHANSVQLIKELKQGLWITRGTRAIFLDFTIYNANINVFVICKLIFECSPLGGILPSHSFDAVHLVYYQASWDFVTGAFEGIVYIMAIYFLAEEIRELVYFKMRYFLQFWNYIEVIIIIVLSVANGVINIIVIYPRIDDTISAIEHQPESYGNLEYLGDMKVLANNFAASLVFFSYIKLFKYLNFNKTMGQLNNTLKRCAFDILGFSIMFFIIFFAFAELGYLVFGSHVRDFNSFGVAMFTLLRTILGDFNYAAIEQANRVLAPIYFLSYIFLVFFVLLNMFLAIINDTYADVKTEIAIQPDEMQMTDFLKRGFYKILRKCSCCKVEYKEPETETNETTQKIRKALKKCGFSDLEIEMFFARYNIDPLAEVGDHDVKKIMKELEGRSMARENMEEDSTLVHVNDFLTQQERLEEIEGNIEQISNNVEDLISKLDSLENVRRG